jgi:hypothetical protein
MKRALVVSVLVGSLTVGATIAEAVTAGLFRGSIDQGGTINVRVNSLKRVARVSWSNFPTFPCPDDGDGNPGDDETAEGAGSRGSASGLNIRPNSRTKRFRINLANSDRSILVFIRGKAGNTQVVGTFRQVQYYTQAPPGESDTLDPQGPTKCDTGNRRFRAPIQR